MFLLSYSWRSTILACIGGWQRYKKLMHLLRFQNKPPTWTLDQGTWVRSDVCSSLVSLTLGSRHQSASIRNVLMSLLIKKKITYIGINARRYIYWHKCSTFEENSGPEVVHHHFKSSYRSWKLTSKGRGCASTCLWHLLESIIIDQHQSTSTSINLNKLASISIIHHQSESTNVSQHPFYPLSSILSIFIHWIRFHPFLSIFIHFHPFASESFLDFETMFQTWSGVLRDIKFQDSFESGT